MARSDSLTEPWFGTMTVGVMDLSGSWAPMREGSGGGDGRYAASASAYLVITAFVSSRAFSCSACAAYLRTTALKGEDREQKSYRGGLLN